MNEIIPLFSTPVYYSNIENLDYDEIASQLQLSNFKDSYLNILLSTEEYVIDKLPKLKQNIIEHVNNYLFNNLQYKPYEYYFSDSWFVKIKSNGHSIKHLHTNSMYSGVVYLDLPKSGGEIKFYSTENNSTLNTVKYLTDVKESNIYNSNSWSFKPTRGDILLFPSYLFHQVLLNESSDVRHSFAFNILPDNYRCRSVIGSRITER